VQKIMPFHDGGVKLTIAKYYTPSGKNIDKIGIKPDVVVKEKKLTDGETKDLAKILKGQLITQFVDSNPTITPKMETAFINGLRKKGIHLDDRLLKKLIRNEIDLHMDVPPVYDLEYDLTLQEAVRRIRTGMIKGVDK